MKFVKFAVSDLVVTTVGVGAAADAGLGVAPAADDDLVVLAVVGHEAEVGVVAGLDGEGHGVVGGQVSLVVVVLGPGYGGVGR